MPDLQQLSTDHAPAVLSFELANRAYFARFISDRGDGFFDQFDSRLDALLAEQDAGICAFYVLVAADGSVIGRFNLYDLVDGSAEVGYRVAESAAGRGVATAALQRLCVLARDSHGLRTLTAGTSDANVASQQVLLKAGFTEVGPADPASVGDQTGRKFRRDL